MRALLLVLLLFGAFSLAAWVQGRSTRLLRQEQELAREDLTPVELEPGWGLVVLGRPSGADPLPYPELGWASAGEAELEDPTPALPLTVEAEPAAEPEQPQPTYAPDFVYRVRANDTLGGICDAHYGSARLSLVEAVARYNSLASPDAIQVGQLLYLPDAARF